MILFINFLASNIQLLPDYKSTDHDFRIYYRKNGKLVELFFCYHLQN